MRCLVLACDYDGTMAHDGRVSQSTVDALERLTDTGRKLILVTGRALDDLRRVFSRLDLFERAVVENGAVLYTPATGDARPLGLIRFGGHLPRGGYDVDHGRPEIEEAPA